LTPPPAHSQLRNPLYASTNGYPSAGGFESISEGSSDDSDSKRKRARTATTLGFVPTVVTPPSPVSTSRPASRHKRRGQSLSSLAALQSRSPSPRQGTDTVWTVPCGGMSTLHSSPLRQLLLTSSTSLPFSRIWRLVDFGDRSRSTHFLRSANGGLDAPGFGFPYVSSVRSRFESSTSEKADERSESPARKVSTRYRFLRRRLVRYYL
jgi:hypothetical protein